MRLSEVVHPSDIHLFLSAASKDGVLAELTSRLDLGSEDEAHVLRTLRHREKLGSTAIGRGLAIPHCRTPVAKRLRVLFGRRPGGVPAEAPDDQPVSVFFLLIAPPVEVSNDYLPVLGRIAQLARQDDFTDRCTRAKTAADVLALFRESQV